MGHRALGSLWREAPLWDLFQGEPHPLAAKDETWDWVHLCYGPGWGLHSSGQFSLTQTHVPQGSVSVRSRFSPVTSKPGVRAGSSSVDRRGQAPSDLLFCLQLLPPTPACWSQEGCFPPGPFICIPGRKEKGMSGPLPSACRLPGWTLLLRSQGTGTFPAWVAVACLTGYLSCWY